MGKLLVSVFLMTLVGGLQCRVVTIGDSLEIHDGGISTVMAPKLVSVLSSTIAPNRTLEDQEATTTVPEHYGDKNANVDCLHMGSFVAKALQWLLEDKSDTPDDPRMQFLIHSRAPNSPYRIYAGENSDEIPYSGFVPEKRTVFISHGFMAHGEAAWMGKMIHAYLKLADVNVIAVDWSRYSKTLNYYKAVVNAKNAAHRISQFMQSVVSAYPDSQSWGDIHMIGHSLGAHVSGMAAAEFKTLKANWKIARITGLDPAQPCFNSSPLALSKNDAEFVDIIHTNGNLMAGVGLGLTNPIGHVDFYANGGQRQPGCWKEASMWEGPRAEIMEAVCSHQKSYDYFTESLRLAADQLHNKFWGHKWDLLPENAESLVGKACDSEDCVEMGINADKYADRGVFFVSTGSYTPHCVITESDRLEILQQLRFDSASSYLNEL